MKSRPPRSNTLLRLAERLSVLLQEKRSLDAFTVVTDSSTPRFITEPTFWSWDEKPELRGNGTSSRRSCVFDWYVSNDSRIRLFWKPTSTPALIWFCVSHLRSGFAAPP